MKRKWKEKNARANLLIVAFVLLIVTKIIGNVIIGDWRYYLQWR